MSWLRSGLVISVLMFLSDQWLHDVKWEIHLALEPSTWRLLCTWCEGNHSSRGDSIVAINNYGGCCNFYFLLCSFLLLLESFILSHCRSLTLFTPLLEWHMTYKQRGHLVLFSFFRSILDLRFSKLLFCSVIFLSPLDKMQMFVYCSCLPWIIRLGDGGTGPHHYGDI